MQSHAATTTAATSPPVTSAAMNTMNTMNTTTTTGDNGDSEGLNGVRSFDSLGLGQSPRQLQRVGMMMQWMGGGGGGGGGGGQSTFSGVGSTIPASVSSARAAAGLTSREMSSRGGDVGFGGGGGGGMGNGVSPSPSPSSEGTDLTNHATYYSSSIDDRKIEDFDVGGASTGYTSGPGFSLGGANIGSGVHDNTYSPPTLTSNRMTKPKTTTMNMDIGKTTNSGSVSTPGSTTTNMNANNINADMGSGSGLGGMMMMKQPTITEPEQTHASVSHLLSRGYSLPCSTAAQAFTQLVQPTARFQLALDALVPLLDSYGRNVELGQRILVSYILYSLYAPYPITINPFRSVLLVAYAKERDKAIQVTREGGVSNNEQLVWVLWKILKGDGNDIGPYSPSTLARSPLPPKLRAVNLVLDDGLYNSTADLDEVTYSYFQKQNNYGPSSSSAGNFGHNNSTSANTTARVSPATRTPITVEDDRRNERVVQGMRLLLVARERILTLAEQRVLLPLINDVTASRIITSLDLTPIVARNLSIAHPLFVGLLNNASDDNSNISQFLDVLPFLPPSLASMDLMGRLLRDQSFIKVPGYSTVADLVRMEVLGRFVHECIQWLERAEREEREGLISDDRFGKGVQNLCRFFNSLIKLQIVDPSSDADSAEMMGFALRCSRFEEANVLYRLFALSRY